MLDFATSTADDFSSFGRHLWMDLRNIDTHEEIAQQVSERLFREFIDAQGNPTVALVRVFRLTDVADLSPAVQNKLDKSESRVMALTGTYGIEEDWCRRTESQSHQAIPLSAIAVPQQIPMFQEVLTQLGIDLEQFYATQELVASQKGYKGTFHIAHVPGSTVIPAQDQFVQPYGIQSLVGFGGFIGQEQKRSLFLLYVFALVPISSQAAENFNSMQEFIGTALAGGDKVFK